MIIMPQVSKNLLSKEVEDKVLGIFLETFAQIRTKERAEKLLSDLLTPTERVMLAKRLAIAYMVFKGYDYRTISRVLKVSLATVARIKNTQSLSGEGFKLVIKKMVLYDKIDTFLAEMVEKATGVIPPKGRDWSQWRKERELERRKRKQPF
jgi:uncharacterized protein YerC